MVPTDDWGVPPGWGRRGGDLRRGGVLSATAKHRPARSWLEALNERRVNWWVDGKNRLKAA